MFRSGFSEKKLKVNLRLAINRLKLLEKKKTELAMKERKDIAEYIRASKLDRARIRVEHIIREDYLVEAMEIVEMYADILMTRLGLLMASKSLDESLKKPVSSLIWVSIRLKTSVDELRVIHDQLGAYYGKEYMTACHSNDVGTVCERLMRKLDPSPPQRSLVEKYLIEIARASNIDFTPDEDALREELGPVPAAIAESELIAFYDKNVDPPYDPKGPDGGPGGAGGGGGGGGHFAAHVPFTYPPSASAPVNTYNGASGYTQPNPGAATLPPYSPNDPNQIGGATYMGPPPDMPESSQAPPLPHKDPAGSPEKSNFVDPGASAQMPPNDEPPQNNMAPPKPAPRSVSPGIPDLPSVPSSFSTPPTNPDGGSSSGGGNDVDFDDLTRRFENLRNKK